MRRNKRFLAGFLAMALLYSTGIPHPAMAAGFAEGSGTKEDPYVITSAAQLQAVKDDLDAHYRLGGDIDLDGVPWTPVGKENAPFTGTLDGDGHTVANLSVAVTSNCAGLFGVMGVGSAAKNLRLENPSVSGDSSARALGPLAGKCYGTVENCHATGARVEAYLDGGGLLGDTYDGAVITNCSAQGAIVGNQSGGFVGMAYGGSFTSCYAIATVSNVQSSSVSIGGFAGRMQTSSGVTGYVDNCFSMATLTTVDVTGTSFLVGGFTGYLYKFELTDCYAVGSGGDVHTETGTRKPGGFCGEAATGKMTNCYAAFAVPEGGRAFGTVGGAVATDNCYYDSAFGGDSRTITAKTRDEMTGEAFVTALGDSFAYTATDANYAYYPQLKAFAGSGAPAVKDDSALSARILLDSAFAGGEGTPKKPYLIETPEQLDAVRKHLDGSFVLKNDVDLSGYDSWTPIGTSGAPFTGTFNGGNHAVTGLTITGAGRNIGLFGYAAAPAAIQSLGVETSPAGVNGHNDAGILLGHGSGIGGDDTKHGASVANCYAKGKVTTSGGTAGLLVGFTTGDITRCYATGEVTAEDAVGGLAGFVRGGAVISTSYADSAVVKTKRTGLTESSGAGGLVGLLGDSDSSATARDCYAAGSVKSPWNTGGLVGILSGNSLIERCYATTTVNGGDKSYAGTGGIVGQMYSRDSKVSNSVFLGAIPTSGNRIVNEVAEGATIEKCYAWDCVLVAGAFPAGGSANSQDGENKTSAELFSVVTWRQILDTGTKWLISPGKMPTILHGIGTQNSDFPEQMVQRVTDYTKLDNAVEVTDLVLLANPGENGELVYNSAGAVLRQTTAGAMNGTTLYIAAHDANGRLLQTAKGTMLQTTITASLTTEEPIGSMKLFVWTKDLVPLIEKVEMKRSLS